MFVPIVISAHDWAEEVMALEVPNSATAGMDAVIAGLLKGNGNVKGYIDSLQYIWAPIPFIRAGVTGRFNLGVGGAIPFSIPAIVLKVHESDVVNGVASWDFDIRLSALASTGTYTRSA